MIKTKTYSSFIRYRETPGSTSYGFGTWKDRIEYDDGPKYTGDRHINWKSCSHIWNTPPSRMSWTCSFPPSWHEPVHSYEWDARLGGSPSYSVPSIDYLPKLQELWDQFYDQLDLNCSDGVLLYSGILQAVPLVGGALKGVSLLNRAARNLAKSFRRKPFTTVVKSLIQADFIDRFVISPTLDDMRKFADASDYVLRVLNTAQTRNSELYTALQQEIGTTVKSSSGSWNGAQGAVQWRIAYEHKSEARAKLAVLARVTYDQSAISPIKLWAARTGLSRPLDSVWDLIPFSFVIDYFTRAGDFISHVGDALSDQDALRPTCCVVTDAWIMNTLRATSRAKGDGRPQGHVALYVPSSLEAEVSSGIFTRSRVPIMSESGFWDRGGFIQPNLSTVRARTLAELYIQSHA